jgi:hypothetical protein
MSTLGSIEEEVIGVDMFRRGAERNDVNDWIWTIEFDQYVTGMKLHSICFLISGFILRCDRSHRYLFSEAAVGRDYDYISMRTVSSGTS